MKLQGLAVGQPRELAEWPAIVAWTDDGQVYYLSPFGEWVLLKPGPWIDKVKAIPCS